MPAALLTALLLAAILPQGLSPAPFPEDRARAAALSYALYLRAAGSAWRALDRARAPDEAEIARRLPPRHVPAGDWRCRLFQGGLLVWGHRVTGSPRPLELFAVLGLLGQSPVTGEKRDGRLAGTMIVLPESVPEGAVVSLLL